jgi:DNA mismatch repair protein PMS2
MLDEGEVAAALVGRAELEAHGFRIAGGGNGGGDGGGGACRTLRVAGVPVLQYDTVKAEDVQELTKQLLDYGRVVRPLRAVWHSMATKACRTSIMIGTPLDGRAMRRVVGNMATMDHPWNCPHGRPTLRHALRMPPVAASAPSAEPLSDEPPAGAEIPVPNLRKFLSTL